jgi:hypothetical protein
MRKLKWITPKNLGIVEEKSYFEIQLTAQSDSPDISYMLISGDLPKGVGLTNNGLLLGTPNTVSSDQIEFDTIVDFTVRAWDGTGIIADKAFNFVVSAVTKVGIRDYSEFLGTFLDGDRFDHQIELDFFGQKRPTTCRFFDGRIPQGIKISPTGLIYGYLGNKIISEDPTQFGWDKSPWDSNFLDPTRPQNASVYEFTVELNDGIYQDKKAYKIEVLPRDYVVRADRTYQMPYDFTKLEASQNGHLPYLLEESRTLPQIRTQLARHDTNFTFKFNAVDLDNDEFYYEITSPDDGGFDQDSEVGFDQDVLDPSDYPMPRGIGLTKKSGWYTGHLARQNKMSSNHTVTVYARKKLGRDYSGEKTNFNITVLGDFENEIRWITDSDLGTIVTGNFSTLKVEASNTSNLKLYYKLKSSILSRTPQGLVLLPTGEISGRVSFKYFSLNKGHLTLDGDKTTFDRTYTFTVIAHDLYYAYYSEKTFTLKTNVVSKTPYDMLYLRAMPDKKQRKLLKSIIEDEHYFPSKLIYRPSDPQWGKKTYLEFLVLTGLEPGDLISYLPAIAKNHYTKTFTFGEVKTAAAVDANYNTVYEVVYLEVIDSQLGIDTKTGLSKYPKQDISLTKLSNFYSIGGVDQQILSPNGLGNMVKQVTDNIEINQSAQLPLWMTSMQPDPQSISGFSPPLGYTPAVILGYTEPGASKTIEYRLKYDKVPFNNIEFTTDRYLLDNVLAKHYDVVLKEFLPGKGCYIDQYPSVAEQYRKKPSVSWAIEGKYSDISGHLVSDLITKNFFDGPKSVANGDTLVLIQIGSYMTIDDYSTGWVDNRSGSVISGYLNKVLDKVDNQRSGVYQVFIDNDGYLFLDLLNLSEPGDIVTVENGNKYGGKQLCLDAYLVHGNEPTWREFNHELILEPISNLQLIKPKKPTTFDSNATRFVSNRDQFYINPNIEDKYIKFPKTGVFI